MSELEILRSALLDIAANRVNGRPTVSAGTAMLALAKARRAQPEIHVVINAPAGSASRPLPSFASPSFIRL